MARDRGLAPAFNQVELARSAYRAWRHASGVPGAEELEDTIGATPMWMRLAAAAEDLIEAHQGKPFLVLAAAMYEVFTATGASLPVDDRRCQLIWEAMARHIAALSNADRQAEVGDLGQLEESWKQWVAEKLRKEKSQ